MHFSKLMHLLALGFGQPKRPGRDSRRVGRTNFSRLNDHELRDIGFEREKPRFQHRYLIRM